MTIHDDILGNMWEMRYALARRYNWYLHVTPAKNASSIREKGLLTGSDQSAGEIVRKHFGDGASNIICLNPLGSDRVPPPVRSGPYICLALDFALLPHRFSLDWSHMGGWEIADVLRAENLAWSAAEIFCKSLKRYGSLLVYDPIAPDGLRAYTRGRTPHDPTNWPFLRNVADEDLQLF